MREDRCLNKIERFLKEEEFINSHGITDGITERALLYAIQISVEIATDIAAMKVRDMGLKVEDDATNIEKLITEKAISKKEGEFLRQMNGVRNSIVHRYETLDMNMVNEAKSRIGELEEIILKIVEY
ncbi:MAG: DUF86 domain-containing protein [Candidatus Methanoperedens sp.]|nr:DUF86 domain-containing protein [Candidatus Methanoperedens sp.]